MERGEQGGGGGGSYSIVLSLFVSTSGGQTVKGYPILFVINQSARIPYSLIFDLLVLGNFDTFICCAFGLRYRYKCETG